MLTKKRSAASLVGGCLIILLFLLSVYWQITYYIFEQDYSFSEAFYYNFWRTLIAYAFIALGAFSKRLRILSAVAFEMLLYFYITKTIGDYKYLESVKEYIGDYDMMFLRQTLFDVAIIASLALAFVICILCLFKNSVSVRLKNLMWFLPGIIEALIFLYDIISNMIQYGFEIYWTVIIQDWHYYWYYYVGPLIFILAMFFIMYGFMKEAER